MKDTIQVRMTNTRINKIKMKSTKYLFIFLILIFISCKNSSDKNDEKSDLISKTNYDSTKIETDSLSHSNEVNNDSLLNENSKNEELISVQEWKTEDFIINEKDKKNQSLKSNIEYKKEEWKNVKNPFIATYKGCDFGDYFHITFEDTNGKVYDFGFGNNHFGEYLLYNGEQYEDNPKYLNKKFKVYWNWKKTTFPCCDGEYESVEAYLPAITKLELGETK